MDGPQMAAANAAPTNTVMPCARWRTSVCSATQGLRGDEDEPVADARQDSPHDEVDIVLCQKRTEISDGRGQGPPPGIPGVCRTAR